MAEISTDWAGFVQSNVSKIVDASIVKRMSPTPAAIPPVPRDAVPAPGVDGKPIKPPFDIKWLALGGAVLLSVVVLLAIPKAAK